ncbi:MAG: hypothetical protein CVU39_12800 [Chloroflexi bacterium HGW-Chloroflexi-10]|nr:MAG: hypothetical protein CVU39_12800 [Chloroflexi bacterium HGW-Chloroflexi-10]
MKTLSIKQVNRLYLVTMLLVLTLGSLMQYLSFTWGLIGTEVLLIMLPAIWFLRRQQIDIPSSIGIRRTRGSILLVSLMLGGGAWLVGSQIELMMVGLTGYTTPTPAGIIPTNFFQAALIFIGLAVAAPVCEEILFRGVIQNTYQAEKSAAVAITIASLMFVFYHMRLQGLPALLPVAFILGYVYWRTRSLYASMAVHFANNFFPVILLVQAGLFPEMQLPFPSLPAAAFGLLLIPAGLVLLNRLTRTPIDEPAGQPTPEPKKLRYWPLVAAFGLYTIMAIVEVGNAAALAKLTWNPQQLPTQTAWTYEMRHKGGELVGEAECGIITTAEAYRLACQRSNEAFEIQVDNSFYSSLAGSTELTAEWSKENLNLIHLEQTNTAEQNFSSLWQIEPHGQQLKTSLQNNHLPSMELQFAADALVEEEWAWRAMALPFANEKFWVVQYLNPLTWREKTKDSGPVVETSFIRITGPESVAVPAGTFQTWKVQLGLNQSAWYRVDEPHILLKYASNVFDYELTKEE